MSDDPELLNYYTQRQWDRTVGWGKVPDEYSLLEYLKKAKETYRIHIWTQLLGSESPTRVHQNTQNCLFSAKFHRLRPTQTAQN